VLDEPERSAANISERNGMKFLDVTILLDKCASHELRVHLWRAIPHMTTSWSQMSRCPQTESMTKWLRHLMAVTMGSLESHR
jgi:hypothetical protein